MMGNDSFQEFVYKFDLSILVLKQNSENSSILK